jgi:hypothetical protein
LAFPQTDDTRAVRQNKLTKLRAKNYAGDDEEWAAILAVTLLRQRPEGNVVEALKGLEIVASLNEDNLVVTFRKDIGGIMVC